MGWGDEIMATGEARRLQRGDPRPVAVRGRDGRQRWHPVWAGNPRMATPEQVGAGRDVQWIDNGPGCRPYIDHARMRRDFEFAYPGQPYAPKRLDVALPWRFTGWRATPGELPAVKRPKHGAYIVVEPNTKASASPNKDWDWQRWQALVLSARWTDAPWVQVGPPGTRVLDGVVHMPTAAFMDACQVLAGARAAVLPDGGLHHAAAALGIPAVVIFGGFTSPANLGYDAHVNLFAGGDPCGMRVRCAHCERAMASIRPEAVARNLEGILNGTA